MFFNKRMTLDFQKRKSCFREDKRVSSSVTIKGKFLKNSYYMFSVVDASSNIGTISILFKSKSEVLLNDKFHFKLGGSSKRIFRMPVSVDCIAFEVGNECSDKNLECILDISYLLPFYAVRLMKKKLHINSKTADTNLLYLTYCAFFDTNFNLSSNTYMQWIKLVESRASIELESISVSGPLISIVIPHYNSNLNYFKICMDSILEQSYKNFQICIADDASTNENVLEYLRELDAEFKNVDIVLREKNGHISEATNSALELVKGDYVVFLDHDDVLAKHALKCIASEVVKNPNLLLIYSDEDKIDIEGSRFSPHFKPGFSPDLLMSQNYISHMTVLKSDLVKRVGGLRRGYEGSQDHDLLLRCLPYLNKDNVLHIPLVLYHWRAIEGSTALDSSSKSYTSDAGLKAVNDYLYKYHRPAYAKKGVVDNTYKTFWPILNNTKVSLLIPTRDGLEFLKPCVESILKKTLYENYEILILDNDSSQKSTLDYFYKITKDNSNIRVIKCPGEFNYSKINNIGVENAMGDIIGLINNDIEIQDGQWLAELVSHAIRDDVGCVGAKLLYPNDTIQHGGVILGLGGVANHSHMNHRADTAGYFGKMTVVHNVSAVTGACLFVKKSIYLEVGGLEEKSLKVAFNDVDFCLKVLNRGYRNIMNPTVALIHHESVSRGLDTTKEKRERLQNEINYMKSSWGESLNNDYYYNSNFSLGPSPASYQLTLKY